MSPMSLTVQSVAYIMSSFNQKTLELSPLSRAYGRFWVFVRLVAFLLRIIPEVQPREVIF